MSAALNFEVSQHSKRILYVTDRTGLYDPGTNPPGWGVSGDADPNANISDIQDIGTTPGIVFLIRQAGVTYSYQDTAAVLSLGWPNTTNQRLALTAANFGLETFADGEVEFTAQVAGEHAYDDGSGPVTEGFQTEKTVRLFFYKQAECCVEKLAAAVDTGCVDKCTDPSWKAFDKADKVFEAMMHQIDDSLYTDAACTLVELQTICSQENASCDGC